MYTKIKTWWLKQDFPVQFITAALVIVPVGSFLITTWMHLMFAYAKWLRNTI